MTKVKTFGCRRSYHSWSVDLFFVWMCVWAFFISSAHVDQDIKPLTIFANTILIQFFVSAQPISETTGNTTQK